MTATTARRARRSANGKFVVCGYCGAILCRRDYLTGSSWRPDGFYLVWDDGWRLREDGYIERQPGAADRLAAGHPPTAHDWMNAARLALSEARRRFAPTICDGCGTVNTINPNKLGVRGVASPVLDGVDS